MTTYWITKREPCDHKTANGMPRYPGEKVCWDCNGLGYIETQIDADQWLIERLGQIEWTSPTGFADFLLKTERMTDVMYKDK